MSDNPLQRSRSLPARLRERQPQPSLRAARQILSRSAPMFRLLEEAAARPACRFPVNWEAGPAAVFRQFANFRAAVRLVTAKAFLEARDGDTSKALSDIALIFRMTDQISGEPTLFSQLVRFACQGIAVHTLNRVTEIAPCSRSDARRMYQTLRGIDDYAPFTHGVEGERCFGLWMFNMVHGDPAHMWPSASEPRFRRLRPFARPGMFLWMPFFKQDQVLYLRQMERVVDLSRQPFRATKDEYAALERGAERLPWYATLTRTVTPLFSRAVEQRDRAIANIGLAQHGMALRAYQEATGRYPASFVELRKKVDWPLPRDPFSGKDFIYRREGKGYLLYSIGPNMKDEGGKDRRSVTSSLPAGQEPPDDIPWRMSR